MSTPAPDNHTWRGMASKIADRAALPGWRPGLQTWFAILALGLVLWFTINYAGLILEVIWVLFGAILLSLAIRPIADALVRWRIPRGVTVLGVYAGVLGGLILLGNLLVPVVGTEIARLQANLPALLQAALSRVAAVSFLKQWIPSTNILAQNLNQRVDVLVGTFFSAVAGVGGLALDMLIVLVLAYFFATDTGMKERVVNDWVPGRHRPRVQAVMAGLSQRLTRWVWAQIAIAFYFALTFSVGLVVLGVPFAFTIGLVGGVLEIVPYLGGLVAVLLAIVSALTVYPLLAVWVALFYLAVIEIESHIIAPAVYGRVMGLHPAVVLVALLIGAKFKGVIGVFFAIPIAVVLAALMHEVQATWLLPETESATQADDIKQQQ